MLAAFDLGSFIFGIAVSWALLLLIIFIAVALRGDGKR